MDTEQSLDPEDVLLSAVKFGDVNGISVILKQYKDTDLTKALQFASEKSKLDVVKVLVEVGRVKLSSVLISGSTLLHWAVFNDDVSVINYLISNGIDANSKDALMNTPLIIAAGKNGRSNQIEHLIDLGAKLNIRNKSGNTALHVATWKGCSENVSCLIDRGVIN